MRRLRVVIFAKAPRTGEVKTRLIPALGAQGAAALAKRMLSHTITQALAADIGAVELCRTDADDPVWHDLRLPARLLLTAQGAGDLGERMARASRRVVESGDAVLLIGTDCPALDRERLREMAGAMARSDVTLIPAMDGGYVALGLMRFDSEVFRDIAWSTDRVLGETLARVRDLGWSMQQLPAQVDIDEPADLQQLPPGWHTAGARVETLAGITSLRGSDPQ